jgi:RNA polymerase sigma factor (sigma-70 family)
MAIVNGEWTVEWVRRAQGGDPEASETLCQQSRPIAVRLAYRILADSTLAEDAAQEALTEAWRNLPRLRDPAAFPGFLQRIVRKHCDRIRRRSLSSHDGLDLLTRSPDPAETALRRECTERLYRALESLPPGEHRVVSRYYFDGSAVAEVAAETGEPVGTVKYRLHEARKRLRKELGPMLNETNMPNSEALINEVALSLYEAYTSAFVRRDAAGILSLYLPTYRLFFTNGEVMDYATVRTQVQWEMTADLPQPRTMTFTIEEVLPDATPERFTVRIRSYRRGEGVKDSPQGVLRDDSWQKTPEGWKLAGTRSLVPMPRWK